ncbi:hypothetical protein [Roseibium aggregatum]|uniref:Uncharacterized protein n=1 Tax=Roseibium aggregatum TaxID=187304 RepID=A0A926SAR5_9HYPH|nr:hypothetical protein [Roseibium aggregatum]MBD1549759.1 hypothetical protein [Roseibium aggregatum]
MTAETMPAKYRVEEFFSHIDMGFLNRRLAISSLGPLRDAFIARQKPGDDHMTRLANDHLLVTMLIDICSEFKAPSLAEALTLGQPRAMFMSTERLEPCPEIRTSDRVTQRVHLEFDYGKPVVISYHTAHIVSDTGRMVLIRGYADGYREAIIGLLHDKGDRFEIEPIVMGAPFIDHPRNAARGGSQAVWCGYDYGEILAEDIAEFSKIRDVTTASADEWMKVMKRTPEAHVKAAIAQLLSEPTKKDWGGEENDHFSSNVTVAERRRTAAFLLKGPTRFEEMTPAMCGKNGDQIYRLTRAGADVSVVQHSHLIGAAVRETLRAMVVTPGHPRFFCVMDGQVTYRLLKAYTFLFKMGTG